MYRISGIIPFPARNQVSGWIRYQVSGTKQYPVLSGILYPVDLTSGIILYITNCCHTPQPLIFMVYNISQMHP